MYCSSVDEINGKHYIFTFCGIVPTRADHLYPGGVSMKEVLGINKRQPYKNYRKPIQMLA